MKRQNSSLFTKSYRSTFEIIEFAKGIMENSAIEVIERHGEEVEIISCEDKSEQFAKMERHADHFTREEDHGSLGIICKTNADAQKLHEKLSKTCHVHLLSPDRGQFKKRGCLLLLFRWQRDWSLMK